MITVGFTPEFFRHLKKLSLQLQALSFERIDLFRDKSNHRRLKVHKLHGKYQGFFGFSVDRKYRIMFEWISKNEARLHTVGDHSIYE
ncbi:MAG: type II toxin-antitoxin system mRNA interferase toxin, RelE/StbE family [bacterium]|nr:type II toxin-antitoxin system mRNA interferase toxin, RelE/StbE family [bacterium]